MSNVKNAGYEEGVCHKCKTPINPWKMYLGEVQKSPSTKDGLCFKCWTEQRRFAIDLSKISIGWVGPEGINILDFNLDKGEE